ncbi:DUF1488 family protein [Caballeronia mineralivorans]|jgi:hypothetical protein|uniref:DUF1488 family protein n=1 Tax=Caballeronia mineralivorans TaxID=2010198 RepID=UPI003211EA54|nr:hypothetical protein [Caballeronia mineralivorans]
MARTSGPSLRLRIPSVTEVVLDITPPSFNGSMAMDNLLDGPHLSSDKKSVVFIASSHGRTMECAITREALTLYFWAPADASDARLLKAFADGSRRITAVAERKMLTATHEPVILTAIDFAKGRA